MPKEIPIQKGGDMPNRYSRITGADLSQAIDDLHLTAGQAARLLGTQRKRIIQWLEEEDIPHHVTVMVELLKLPGAMEIARKITDEAILETEEDA
jgi:hypothetical protein